MRPIGQKPRVFFDARKARDFGIGRYVTGLLGALARQGEFGLVALVRPGDEAVVGDAVEVLVSSASNYGLRELFSVKRAFRRSGADLLHAPHYVVPVFPPGATTVTVHDLMHLTRPEHRTMARQLYARSMIRHAVRSAARVIAVSEATRKELERHVPGSRGRTVVIPNGVESSFFAAVPERERARARRERRLSMPYLLFLGNDKPHKNVEGLLAAFASLRREQPLPHRLVLAGGAAERGPRRRALVERLGLSGTVLDLGVLPEEDLVPVLAEADALVLPSFTEGFGLPVVEAQAMGVPVVCSPRGGLLEAAGDAALFAEPDDPRALTAALGRILTDEPLRRELSRKGRSRASAFTWEAAAERTAAVYREVLYGVPGQASRARAGA